MVFKLSQPEKAYSFILLILAGSVTVSNSEQKLNIAHGKSASLIIFTDFKLLQLVKV